MRGACRPQCQHITIPSLASGGCQTLGCSPLGPRPDAAMAAMDMSLTRAVGFGLWVTAACSGCRSRQRTPEGTGFQAALSPCSGMVSRSTSPTSSTAKAQVSRGYKPAASHWPYLVSRLLNYKYTFLFIAGIKKIRGYHIEILLSAFPRKT